MITTAILVTFIVGYAMIALEHPLKIDKAATALLTGIICWSLYMFGLEGILKEGDIPPWFAEKVGHVTGHGASLEFLREYAVEGQLLHSLSEIAGILFFLMGAMTIVELVDAYEGFSIITDRINAKSQVTLLWIVGLLTFFMSSVLDNLTTTIVMVSLLKKLIKDHEKRLLFAGMVVIAANAGGAWTVIGDVTTTMLWIKQKITPVQTMLWLVLPSLVCLIVPLYLISRQLQGPVERPDEIKHAHYKKLKPYQSMLFLSLGFGGLLFVPIFKAVTHLPPFMGVLFSLSVMWIVSELVKHDMDQETRSSTHVLSILKKIDTGSILFFLGILLAINSLGSVGLLDAAAQKLNTSVGNENAIAILIGLLSAVVDNVPLVAAGIEMYDYPVDHNFWLFLAYCAGTGGSCLIIGSAAGVAAMGLEHIDFMWYVRKVSLWALLGYLAGCGVYLAQAWLVGLIT
jgi:Na+/H+ antiporter NhaD/arsenite permease-like protein